MARQCVRRPSSTIESMAISNIQDDEGYWIPTIFKRLMWITMQPSSRGAHKVPRRHMASTGHHWKGRILEFKVCKDGKRLAKVQHVYTSSQIHLEDENPPRFPTNYVFPSTCVEWQSLECFTGTFEACHVDLGKLMYAGETSSELANRGVFFFAATYVVPQRGRFGALEPISAPAINSPEWPIPDPIIMESFQRRIFHDIQSSLKPTYGSHRIIVSLFMPLYVFIAIFKAGKFHRTPTMWISKDGTFEALDTFLKGDWTTKVAEHQGDVIKCSAVMSMVRCRYQIGKQNLTMVYPIRRWKRSRGEWEALDSDLYAREEVELHIEVLPGEEHTVVVNDDWNFAQLRERIVMSFNVRYQFKFVVSNRPMRHRSEKHTLCVSLEPPRVLSLKEC